MEIKVIRIYLTGSKRIHELYEEKQQALLKQEELRRAVRAQDRQMKGYGKDFEAMLREQKQLREEIEVLKRTCDVQHAERDKWERLYRESEKARQSLGKKLNHALDALEMLKERGEKEYPPAPGTSSGASATFPVRGEGKRAVEDAGPCGVNAVQRPLEGGMGR